MTVTIRIVGDCDAKESVQYADNCETARIEKKLFIAYGPGILKQGKGMDSETLSGGDYEYLLTKRATVKQPGKYWFPMMLYITKERTNLITVLSSVFLYHQTFISFCQILSVSVLHRTAFIA